MRKVMAIVVAIGLLGALGAAPASAGKKKSITEEFSATGLPLPNQDGTGCIGTGAIEGVHYTRFPFKAPANGILSTVIEGFTGDWDLFVLDENGGQLGVSDAGQTISMAPPIERIEGISLRKGDEVFVTVCNWLAAPTVSGSYTFVYK